MLIRAIVEEIEAAKTSHIELNSPVTYEMIGDNCLEVTKVYEDGTFYNNRGKQCTLLDLSANDLRDVLQNLLSNEDIEDEIK